MLQNVNLDIVKFINHLLMDIIYKKKEKKERIKRNHNNIFTKTNVKSGFTKHLF